MSYILDVGGKYIVDDALKKFEEHAHLPYASQTLNNNDEITIPIHQQDVYTLPARSYLYVEGSVTAKKADQTETTVQLVNNAVAFLFEEIRYEIGGMAVDRTKNVGITTTIKNILSTRKNQEHALENAGWKIGTTAIDVDKTKFRFCTPLHLLMGWGEHYQKIVLNVEQRLTLLRGADDANAVITALGTNSISLKLDKVQWVVPYITVEDAHRHNLLKLTDVDRPIAMPFRTWQLYEYPVLPTTTHINWVVKTSSQEEKPRYVVLAFQTGRKNDKTKDNSHFDLCNLYNVRLHLNEQFYPYMNLMGNTSVLYKWYSNFLYSYYGIDEGPALSLSTFTKDTPLVFIDCSHQNESLKAGPVDVRLEIETSENIPANTAAYCVIIYDTVVQYTPLTNRVSRLM